MKIESSELVKESAERRRDQILKNANLKFDDYIVAPSSTSNSNE